MDEPGKVTANDHVVALGARQHKVYAYLCLVSQCFACLRRKVREKNALAFWLAVCKAMPWGSVHRERHWSSVQRVHDVMWQQHLYWNERFVFTCGCPPTFTYDYSSTGDRVPLIFRTSQTLRNVDFGVAFHDDAHLWTAVGRFNSRPGLSKTDHISSILYLSMYIYPENPTMQNFRHGLIFSNFQANNVITSEKTNFRFSPGWSHKELEMELLRVLLGQPTSIEQTHASGDQCELSQSSWPLIQAKQYSQEISRNFRHFPAGFRHFDANFRHYFAQSKRIVASNKSRGSFMEFNQVRTWQMPL